MATFKSLMIYLIIEFCRPNKTIDFIQQLLNFHEISLEAHQSHKWGKIIPFYAVHIFFLIIGFYLLCLSQSHLSPINALIFGDLLRMYDVSGQMHFLVILHLAMAVYYFHVLFNNLDYNAIWLTQAILDEKPKEIFYKNFRYKNQPITLYMKQRIRSVLNILVSFVYGFSKFTLLLLQESLHDYFTVFIFVVFEFVLIKKFLDNYKFFSKSINIFYILINQTLMLVYLIAFLLFISITILVGVMAFSELLTWNFRFKQMQEVFNSSKKLKTKLLILHRLYVKHLVSCLKSQKMYGNIFLCFVVINYPANCVVVYYIFNISDLVVRFALLLVFMEQIISILLFHAVIANLNAKLFRIAKQMTSQLVPNNHQFKIKTKLKLNLFVLSVYTKKEYGFRYGNIGQVSMITFLKVKI